MFNEKLEKLSYDVIGKAIKIHTAFGPGMMEKAYQQLLAYELSKSGFRFQLEKEVPLLYEGIKISCGYRIDMLIEDSLIIELKCVDKIIPIHEAQILTYMKITGIRLGLLINFNTVRLKDGIKRFAL